jgi:general secretion pathway protein L
MRAVAHRFALPAFWSWWTGELARAAPAVSRTAVQRRRVRPVLAFAAGEAVLWVPGVVAGTLELVPRAHVSLAGDPKAVAQAGRSAIEDLARGVYGGVVAEPRLRVALPEAQVLRKTLVLPAAVEENLRQTIAWDLDRYTPFSPEQLYFDAVIAARDLEKKTVHVEWAAALRSHVDQAVKQARAWGATVVAVTAQAPGETGAAVAAGRLNLLPEEERPEVATWRRWRVWLPLAVVVAAVAAAAAVPIWQKREAVLAVLKETEQARAQAGAADALRSEFERMTGDYNFALAKKYAFPPAVQLVEDVTRLLPDDTWLLQFELKTSNRGKEPQREVVLRGESASAGRLVALLEDSKLFEQASPRSPMTKIQPGPGEIFDLGAQLKPLPPPAMLELVAGGGDADAASSPSAEGAATSGKATVPAQAVPAATGGAAPAEGSTPAKPPAPAAAVPPASPAPSAPSAPSAGAGKP